MSAAGHPLPRYYRALAALIRHAYFRVRQVGVWPPAKTGARLIVSSHRNGAIDGYVVMQAFPQAQFLVSVQLLRSRWLRLLFSGIPVAREKDRVRYGLDRAAYGNPVEAGAAHLRASGDLVVFPEGTSEWGHRPLPYQKGAARMAQALLAEGVPVEVIPVGLHYVQPDRFRSEVEVSVGAPIALPSATPGDTPKAWEDRIHAAISAGLDAVSVHCPDEATFHAAEAEAREAWAAGGSYAATFLAAQKNGPRPLDLEPSLRAPHIVDLLLVVTFLVVTFPVLGLSALAGTRADARNTVTFFRILGSLVGLVLTVPVWVGLALAWPGWASVIGVLVAWGFVRYPRVFNPQRPRS